MNQQHRWRIEIQSNSSYCSVANSFVSDDIKLGYEDPEDGGYYFAYSPHIDALDDTQEVGRRLYSLQLLLNGALRLTDKRPFHGGLNNDFGGAKKTKPDLYDCNMIKFMKFHSIKGGLSGHTYARSIEKNPFIKNSKANGQKTSLLNSPKKYAPCLLFLSKHDEDLRYFLFLIGLISFNTALENILTWGTLYKIYDSIRYLCKKTGLDINSFADMKEIKLFTSACNSQIILGVEARHGLSSQTPPQKTVPDLIEAINIVMPMCYKFSQSYIMKKYTLKFAAKL